MVFTHLPSNVLLTLVPLMPTLPLAIGVLLLRFSISQMDVPTRQSLQIDQTARRTGILIPLFLNLSTSQRSPTNRSSSTARPPFTRLNAR
jgi:hypothetical protein